MAFKALELHGGHGHGFKICPEGPGTSLVGSGTSSGPFLGCQMPGVACEGPGISWTLKVEIADPQGNLLRNLLFRTRLNSIAHD